MAAITDTLHLSADQHLAKIEEIEARHRAGELISAADGYRLIGHKHEFVQAMRREEREKRIAAGIDPGPPPRESPNPVAHIDLDKVERGRVFSPNENGPSDDGADTGN